MDAPRCSHPAPLPLAGSDPGGGRPHFAGLITWEISVDSTIARAHQHAAGACTQPEAQKEPPGGVEAEPAVPLPKTPSALVRAGVGVSEMLARLLGAGPGRSW